MIFEILLSILTFYASSEVSAQETVAFSAIKGERNGPYISYQTILVNNSAKFNPLYGVFMCSDPGLYFFTFQVLSQKDTDLRVSLRINRIPVLTAFSGSKTSYNQASGSVILELEVEDIVYCFVEDGEFYESRQVNRAYTSFSGYKIGSVAGSNSGFFSSLMGRRAPIDANARPDSKVKDKSKNEVLGEIDTFDNIYELIDKQNNNSTIV